MKKVFLPNILTRLNVIDYHLSIVDYSFQFNTDASWTLTGVSRYKSLQPEDLVSLGINMAKLLAILQEDSTDAEVEIGYSNATAGTNQPFRLRVLGTFIKKDGLKATFQPAYLKSIGKN